jgi:5-methylcytosine-specific restriction endonuclease McrA
MIYRSTLAAQKGAGKYCSRECRNLHRCGNNHPQYINGSSSERHGNNWQAQKRKAKRRDKWTCQECGLTHKASMKKYGQPLHIHHKVPYRFFNDNFEKANDLNNLTTLCPECHRKADALFQKLERENNK